MIPSRFRFRAWNSVNQMMNYDIHLEHFGEYLETPDYPIMQSTGLVDKNDKEVWEGDLLGDPSQLILECKWWGEAARFTFFYGKEEYAVVYHKEFPFKLIHNVVIGNIYENPELLK